MNDSQVKQQTKGWYKVEEPAEEVSRNSTVMVNDALAEMRSQELKEIDSDFDFATAPRDYAG